MTILPRRDPLWLSRLAGIEDDDGTALNGLPSIPTFFDDNAPMPGAFGLMPDEPFVDTMTDPMTGFGLGVPTFPPPEEEDWPPPLPNYEPPPPVDATPLPGADKSREKEPKTRVWRGDKAEDIEIPQNDDINVGKVPPKGEAWIGGKDLIAPWDDLVDPQKKREWEL